MMAQLPPVYANAITPFALPGRQPVGQETPDLKNSTLKSLEQAAESGYLQNRRLPDDRPDYPDDQRSSRRARLPDAEQDAEAVLKQAARRQQEKEDRLAIDVLAARDREVRAHEQAHASVGGQYAGSPTYTYQRGPDGVAYAVAGEVAISTSAIAGDPEATLAKARQVRQAAQAPADMSPQDRLVAAAAARLETEALAQILTRKAEPADGASPLGEPATESNAGAEAASVPEPAAQKKAIENEKDQAQVESAHQQQLALNHRLYAMGVWGRATSAPGTLLDRRV